MDRLQNPCSTYYFASTQLVMLVGKNTDPYLRVPDPMDMISIPTNLVLLMLPGMPGQQHYDLGVRRSVCYKKIDQGAQNEAWNQTLATILARDLDMDASAIISLWVSDTAGALQRNHSPSI